MRMRTLVLSFLVHVAVIGAAMAARIVATTELPDPPTHTTFIIAAPELPSVTPPPATAPRQASAPVASPDAVPVVEPDALRAEPIDLPDVAPSGGSVLLGAPGVAEGDLLGVGPPPPAVRSPDPPPPVRPGGNVRAPQKIHHVAPSYPPLARSAGISGIVILEALIAEDGTVRDVKVLRSVPLLDAPATEAVRQWRFTPTLLNGIPVPVVMTVTVAFSLN